MRSGLISHWIKMLHIFDGLRSSAASQLYLSSAGSIINTSGFRFWIGTAGSGFTSGRNAPEKGLCHRWKARYMTAELKVFREVGMLYLWRFGIGQSERTRLDQTTCGDRDNQYATFMGSPPP